VENLTVSAAELDFAGGPCTVLRLAGEADVTTKALAAALDAAVARKPRLLLVEMSALTFIDSSAVHQVTRAYQRLKAEGGALALVSPSGPVARLLDLTQIDRVIPVYRSIEEAAGIDSA
jgi:anti-sigma B factor antagonist